MTRTPSQIRPSIKSGYARSASESAFPALWDKMVGAWIPMLGPTGDKVLNASQHDTSDTGVVWQPLNGISAASAWVQSEHGSVLEFDNNDEWIELGSNRYNMGTDSVSIHAFVNAESGAPSGFGGIFSKTRASNVANRYFVAVRESTSDVRASFVSSDKDNVNVDSTTDIRDAGWSSVTVVYDRTANLGLWINGTLEATEDISAHSGDNINSNFMARVGAQSSSDATPVVTSSFHGQIGSVLYHRRVLSPQEIQLLNADPLAPFRTRRRVMFATPEEAAAFNAYWAWQATRIQPPINLGGF